jgi:hypothetical protein
VAEHVPQLFNNLLIWRRVTVKINNVPTGTAHLLAAKVNCRAKPWVVSGPTSQLRDAALHYAALPDCGTSVGAVLPVRDYSNFGLGRSNHLLGSTK